MRFLLPVVAVLITVLGVLPGTATAQGDPTARLEVSKVTPSVVRAGDPDEIVVAGRVTNTSAQPLAELSARLERGAPVESEEAVANALDSEVSATAMSTFVPIAGPLAPGQTAPFELRVPLREGPESLRISESGTYPVLLNVNGRSAGGRARVAEKRFLLPVLTAPGMPPAPPPGNRVPTTMLVPFVDLPRMEREATPGQRAILTNDELARSIAPGGRLSNLVQAVNDSVGPGSPLASSLCFAIDPDLIATVTSMRGGYLVRQPDGTLSEGIGADAATMWLRGLQSITKGRCVIALPYADADVVALGRAGLPDLIKGALDGSAIVRQALEVEPRKDVLWPIAGALDEPAASELSDFNVDTLLMRRSSLALDEQTFGPVGVDGPRPESAPTVQPVDELLATALDPAPGTDRASGQDALAALVHRATSGARPDAQTIIAPPRRWMISGDALHGLLDGMRALTDSGYIAPTGLPSDNSSENAGDQPPGSPDLPPPNQLPTARLNYPVDAATSEIPQQVLTDLAKQNYKVGELYRASEGDKQADVAPSAITTPLRSGLLRATSSAWRGDPEAARNWLGLAQRTLHATLNSVQVDDFRGRVTLGSKNSPIPLTITNRLPVQVNVDVRVSGPPGLRTRPLGTVAVPPQGSRVLWVEAEVTRVGRFSIDTSLWTAGQTQLGQTKRMQVESTAYDAFTRVFTFGAGGLLLFLFGLRAWRKFRSRRATSPRPTPPSGEAPPGETAGPAGAEHATPPAEGTAANVTDTPKTATGDGDADRS